MSKRFILVMMLLILWASSTPLLHADEPIVRMFLFYSHNCPHCRTVLEEILPPLLEKYGSRLQIRYFDIVVPENYRALLDLEQRYDIQERGIPLAFLGEWVLIGDAAIRDNLDLIITEILEAGGTDFPQPDLIPVPTPATMQPTPSPTATLPAGYANLPPEGCKWCNQQAQGNVPIVYMAYFYDTSCHECDRVSYDLTLLHSRYPNLYIRSFDINEHAPLSEALGERYGIPEEKRLVAPAIFVGQDYLVAPDINMETLTALVEKYATSGTTPPWETVTETTAVQSIVERFQSFTALTVIGAGLIDGLNPCAFAGIIFFISYLAITQRKGREILLVGAAFTAGVFISYLLIGLGILSFVKRLSFIHTFARIIYLATTALCAVLALLSLYDYVQIRRGRTKDMVLRLPGVLQRRLHRVIREHSKVQGFVWAALVTGFLVSLIEFACTGQVYLPTIIFVTGIPGLRAHAVAYLLLYNLLFITPLVVIFVLAFFGTTWQHFNRFLQSNLATVKLLTAGLFVVLAVWLGMYIL